MKKIKAFVSVLLPLLPSELWSLPRRNLEIRSRDWICTLADRSKKAVLIGSYPHHDEEPDQVH